MPRTRPVPAPVVPGPHPSARSAPARPVALRGAPSGPVARPVAGVLVTGAGGPAGIAVIRRLVALGHRVVAADADWRAAGGTLAHASATLPPAGHPRFVDALLGVARVHRTEALISTIADELQVLGPAAERLHDAGLATWLPDPAAVELCCDKVAFAERMHAAAVPHPRTVTTAGEVAGLPGPWIVKPRTGRGSRGVRLLRSEEAVTAALDGNAGLIAQTRLTGCEFTADALVSRAGRLLTAVPRWREETRAGISVKGTTFDSEAVTDLVEQVLTAVGLTGPANVQGFVDDDGRATVVEVNPRFSGGLPLTLAAGADVVSSYLAGILDPRAELPYLYFTPGVRMSRYLAETYSSVDGAPVDDPCAVAVGTT